MSSDLSPGSVFAERYRIERRIATGGMGAVYEVVHLETNRRRAMKVLHPNLVQSEDLRQRFRQEARVAAEIESEFIVDVFDAGIDASTEAPFLVMELLRGEDVREHIRRLGPMPAEEAVRCLYEASLALDKTHQARIVHRDLKPDNLYLCEREHGPPRVKVLDFGVAKIIADGAISGQTRESLGTPLYMAPEQFLMSGSISAATDVFALGLIAYTMLVGKPYWLDESKRAGAAVAFALHACRGPQESAVARAAQQGITLPPTFDTWFFRAVAAKPEDRFQVASQAIIELAQALGVSVEVSPLSRTNAGPVSRSTLSSGVGNMPPYRPPMPSVPPGFGATPLPSVPTDIGSGLTSAGPPVRNNRSQLVAMVAGALVTLVIGGVVFFQFVSSSSPRETPELGAPPVTATPSASIPGPDVKPMATIEPTPAPSASSSTASTPSTSTTKPATAKTTTEKTDKTDKPPVRPTATSTAKKQPGGNIWNND